VTTTTTDIAASTTSVPATSIRLRRFRLTA
jgi:hypothetical protein